MQVIPQCLECRRYLGDNKCEAYKDIPIEILTGEHNHTTEFKGDNGVLFQEK